MRIWVQEPQDPNPFPIYPNENWVVADLAIYLSKHPEFTFNGIQSKLISINHGDHPLDRDTLLSSIKGNSAESSSGIF